MIIQIKIPPIPRVNRPITAIPLIAPVYLKRTGTYAIIIRYMSMGLNIDYKKKNHYVHKSNYMLNTHWKVHPTRAKVEFEKLNNVFRGLPFVRPGDILRDKLYWSLPPYAVDFIWNMFTSRYGLIYKETPYFIAYHEGDIPDYASIRRLVQSDARVETGIRWQVLNETRSHSNLDALIEIRPVQSEPSEPILNESNAIISIANLNARLARIEHRRRMLLHQSNVEITSFAIKCFGLWVFFHYGELAYHIHTIYHAVISNISGWGVFKLFRTLIEYLLGYREYIFAPNEQLALVGMREVFEAVTPTTQPVVDLPVITADTPIESDDGILPLEPHGRGRLINTLTVFLVGASLLTLYSLAADVAEYERASDLVNTLPSVVLKHFPEIKKIAIPYFIRGVE